MLKGQPFSGAKGKSRTHASRLARAPISRLCLEPRWALSTLRKFVVEKAKALGIPVISTHGRDN